MTWKRTPWPKKLKWFQNVTKWREYEARINPPTSEVHKKMQNNQMQTSYDEFLKTTPCIICQRLYQEM